MADARILPLARMANVLVPEVPMSIPRKTLIWFASSLLGYNGGFDRRSVAGF